MDTHGTNGFDAIVVGSGLGGLIAGALYARSGRRVLVIERNEVFGGAATVYCHGGLSIEASLHEIDGLDPDDPKVPLLNSLGLDHDLHFVPVGDLYEVRGPVIGEPFTFPHGIEAALVAMTARLPHHAVALRRYFIRIRDVRDAVGFASQHQEDRLWWLLHAPTALRKLWPLIRHGRASVGSLLQELFGDDEAIKIALAANLAYYHDDPDTMQFLRFAIPQASYLIGGGHYIRGGSSALSSWLVSRIREAGGTVQAGREARRLVIDGNRVMGVEHAARRGADIRVDLAPVVFGNAAPECLAEMLPEGKRAVFRARYAGKRPSIALWTIAIGLNRPAASFGVRRYATWVYPGWMKRLADMRVAAKLMAAPDGARLPPYVLVDYGQIDSGLNAAGPRLATLCGVDSLANWSGLSDEETHARKERWMERLVADLDREFPGIAGAIVHREMATAETMHRYLNTPGGAVYGFAPERQPGEFIALAPKTTIDGLWLASAYTFSGGFTGAILGGGAAASAAAATNRSHVRLHQW